MTLPTLRIGRLKSILAALAGLTLVIGLVITPIENKFGRATTFSDTSILSVLGVTMFGIVVALVTVELFRSEQLFYWKRTVERFDRIEELLKKLEKEQGFNLKTNHESKLL